MSLPSETPGRMGGPLRRHPLIVRQPDGPLLDHVVLGTPVLGEGLDYIESLTSVRPLVDEASTEVGRPFASARISLSVNSGTGKAGC